MERGVGKELGAVLSLELGVDARSAVVCEGGAGERPEQSRQV